MNAKETNKTNKITSFTNSQGHRRGHILKRIFKNDIRAMVITEREKRFQFDYCFPERRTYDLAVATLALDSKSGFATYVCTQRSKHCSVRNSQFYDASGAAVNIVPIHLNSTEELGPIKMIVKGDGRHTEKNFFTLAASSYIKGSIKDLFTLAASHYIEKQRRLTS